MVVFHHARNPLPWLYNPLLTFQLGQAGVDIFFVISGFIMYSIAKSETAPDFLRRRILRVAPMYWVATVVSLIVAVNWHFDRLKTISASHVFLSLIFVPHYDPNSPGRIWPYLIPGWTLNYEMFFYGVFALGIASRKPVAVTATILVAAAVLGYALPSASPAWILYTDPIVLEFLLGILVARHLPKMKVPAAIVLLLSGVAALGLSEVFHLHYPRLLIWGLPAALLVMGSVGLETRIARPLPLALSGLGNASYSIYLFQLVALGVVATLFKHIHISGVFQFVAFIATCLLSAGFAGLVMFKYIERPMLRYFNRRPIS